jgi:putative PIN family toxin of toxin-antitoxin system
MRAVLDTNVLLSGLLWRGPSYTLLEQVRNGAVTFLSSPELLAELAEVLERPKFDAVLRTDHELLQQFQEVEKLPEDDKHVVKRLLDAFLMKKQLQALV